MIGWVPCDIPITIAMNIMFTLLIIPEHASGMSPPYTDCAPYLDKVLFMTTWTIAMAI